MVSQGRLCYSRSLRSFCRVARVIIHFIIVFAFKCELEVLEGVNWFVLSVQVNKPTNTFHHSWRSVGPSLREILAKYHWKLNYWKYIRRRVLCGDRRLPPLVALWMPARDTVSVYLTAILLLCCQIRLIPSTLLSLRISPWLASWGRFDSQTRLAG